MEAREDPREGRTEDGEDKEWAVRDGPDSGQDNGGLGKEMGKELDRRVGDQTDGGKAKEEEVKEQEEKEIGTAKDGQQLQDTAYMASMCWTTTLATRKAKGTLKDTLSSSRRSAYRPRARTMRHAWSARAAPTVGTSP